MWWHDAIYPIADHCVKWQHSADVSIFFTLAGWGCCCFLNVLSYWYIEHQAKFTFTFQGPGWLEVKWSYSSVLFSSCKFDATAMNAACRTIIWQTMPVVFYFLINAKLSCGHPKESLYLLLMWMTMLLFFVENVHNQNGIDLIIQNIAV